MAKSKKKIKKAVKRAVRKVQAKAGPRLTTLGAVPMGGTFTGIQTGNTLKRTAIGDEITALGPRNRNGYVGKLVRLSAEYKVLA